MRRFRKIAEECGAVVSWVDDAQADLPQALERMADQLAQQGYPVKDLAERCRSPYFSLPTPSFTETYHDQATLCPDGRYYMNRTGR